MKTALAHPLFVRGACLVALAISLHYLVWRALHTLNFEAPVLSLALYAAECFGLVMLAMHVVLTWDKRSLERRLGAADSESLRDVALRAARPASVDVFIPTYDESLELLRKTVLAAREMRLPHETWVLDDGRRDEVRGMCEQLGVRYLTRESNAHAKAGNINSALARTDGEFIVVLDADFIARPALLERTLPHFDDDRLAFVQLPQAFYNVDSVQHVDGDLRTGWHEQTLFYDVIQPGKNRWNAAFWCGSPAVLRREALESVGGAATSTVTEDILTSMRMHAAGWRSLYWNEILAIGVAPGDLAAYRTQRLRWAQGSMQILRSRENPLWKPGLTLAQRISYLASMTTYLQAVPHAIFVAMPALILVTGQSPIVGLGAGFFVHFIPYMAATMIATKLSGGSSVRLLWDHYFAFLRMFTFLRASLTLVTGGRRLRFRVTPKAPTTSVQRRALYPHVAAMALNVASLVVLLGAPGINRFDGATTAVVAVCAGAVASLYAVALVKLWRRVYRRHHYRVPAGLAASIALDGEAEFLAETADLSFGGVSLVCARRFDPGVRVKVRLLGGNRVTIGGTIVSAAASAGDVHRLGVRFDSLNAEDEHRLLLRLLDAAMGSEATAVRADPSSSDDAAARRTAA